MFCDYAIILQGDIMKKYLFVIDLDGTLLEDWENVTDETVEYLNHIQTLGHDIVLATGRPFRSSEEFYDKLNLKTPLINYNGGLVTAKHDPDFEGYSLTVDLESVLDIFEQNKEHIHNAFGEVIDDIYLLEDTEEIQPLLHNFNGARLFVGDFKDILVKPTNGFIIISKKGHGHHIEDFVETHYKDKVLHRNWGNEYEYIIELFTPETSKGNAIEYVSKYLGYEREDIIAFGDAHNDIEMLQYAGLGVAMKNAQDRLKPFADTVTEFTNKENGVIKFIEKFLKKNAE